MGLSIVNDLSESFQIHKCCFPKNEMEMHRFYVNYHSIIIYDELANRGIFCLTTLMSCSSLDDQPPIIACPPDVNNGTDPERPTRTVVWKDPVVNDNSELHDPNAAPTVVRSPNHISSPYDFPAGTVRITYTATDRSNNSQSCVFTVTITGE